MPNHVDQDLWVSGDVATIREFIEFAQETVDESGPVLLSANKFLPYPEEYRILDEQGKVERAKGNYTFRDGFNSGGYEWCKRVWGTKWGCYDATLSVPTTFGKRKKGTVFYTFRSAWSPAVKIIMAMSEKFPTLKFKLKYYECGMGFKGEYIVCGGQVLKDESGKYSGRRGG
jgi:hypothetical protein